jgi:hypothetical protein
MIGYIRGMKTLGWCFVWLAASVSAQEAGIRLAPSPLELPRTIGPLQGSAEGHQYDDPALGMSYQYSARGTSLTVYVYDAGLKDLVDGPDTIPVCQEFESAKQGVAAAYPNARLVSQHMVRLLSSEQAPLVREAVFEFEFRERPTISYVWITAVARNFIKLRFTADAQLRDELPEARSAILSAMGTAIAPHLAPPAPNAEKPAEKPGNAIDLHIGSDGTFDDDAANTFIYTLALTAMIEKTPELQPACGGEVIPDHATQVALFRGVFADAGLGDEGKFSKRVRQIDEAGFLEEFVWVELHRDSWGKTPPEGLTLKEYATWKRKNLRRFRPPAFGTVSIGYPRPLPMAPDPEP